MANFNFDSSCVLGENNVEGVINVTVETAKALGLPVSPALTQIVRDFEGVRKISKDDLTRYAGANKLQAPWLSGLLRQAGISVGDKGKKAVVTKESVGEVLATMPGADVNASDLPDAIAKALGVKSTQAIVSTLREHYGRAEGSRGRTADEQEIETLYKAYFMILEGLARTGQARPHSSALTSALQLLGRSAASKQHIEAQFLDRGFNVAAGLSGDELNEWIEAVKAETEDAEDSEE